MQGRPGRLFHEHFRKAAGKLVILQATLYGRTGELLEMLPGPDGILPFIFSHVAVALRIELLLHPQQGLTDARGLVLDVFLDGDTGELLPRRQHVRQKAVLRRTAHVPDGSTRRAGVDGARLDTPGAGVVGLYPDGHVSPYFHTVPRAFFENSSASLTGSLNRSPKKPFSPPKPPAVA